MHVCVRGRVVRRHGDGSPVCDRRLARVEHVVGVQDEQVVEITAPPPWVEP